MIRHWIIIFLWNTNISNSTWLNKNVWDCRHQLLPAICIVSPCFCWLQCPHKFPHLTVSHLNAGFDLNGKSIQNCYVVTLFEIVCHLEGGQGGNCCHYITRYCHVFIFRFCWCESQYWSHMEKFCMHFWSASEGHRRSHTGIFTYSWWSVFKIKWNYFSDHSSTYC